MPSDLFLIAHKVRSEPAFDVAIQMACPLCEEDELGCHECDGLGYWWIIPTSGHRAYPWWYTSLEDIDDTYQLNFETTKLEGPGPMPPTLPDHYPTRAAPTISLADLLGLRKPKAQAEAPAQPVHRRF